MMTSKGGGGVKIYYCEKKPVCPPPLGLILLFYLIFYLFLAGMFVLTMYIMLLTLDDYKPTWQDRLVTPGEGIEHTTHHVTGGRVIMLLVLLLLYITNTLYY